MTIDIKHYEYQAPNGKKLRVSGPVLPVEVDKLIAERDAWYERNRRFLEGYSAEQFVKEKRRDVEEGLA